MSVLARSILFGLAFVAALVAILFGLRRRRLAPAATDRGAFTTLRKAFWAAAGLLLGATPACGDPEPGEDADASERDEGIWVECYAAPADAFDDFADLDAEAETEADVDLDVPFDFPGCYIAADVPQEDLGDLDAEADAEAEPDASPDAGPDGDPDGAPDAVDPDADPDGVEPPDGVGEAATPDSEPTCYFAGPKTAGDNRRDRWERRTLLRARAVEQLLAEPGTHPAVRAVLERDLRALRARARRLRAG